MIQLQDVVTGSKFVLLELFCSFTSKINNDPENSFVFVMIGGCFIDYNYKKMRSKKNDPSRSKSRERSRSR